jgi:hypothetical protein
MSVKRRGKKIILALLAIVACYGLVPYRNRSVRAAIDPT